VFRTGFETKNC